MFDLTTWYLWYSLLYADHICICNTEIYAYACHMEVKTHSFQTSVLMELRLASSPQRLHLKNNSVFSELVLNFLEKNLMPCQESNPAPKVKVLFCLNMVTLYWNISKKLGIILETGIKINKYKAKSRNSVVHAKATSNSGNFLNS